MNINVQTLIPLFVALPLAVALLIQLLARRRPVLAEWMSITRPLPPGWLADTHRHRHAAR